MKSYIIRVDELDLTGKIIYEKGIGNCPEHISKEELIENFLNNGLNIVQFAHSSFGACYFFEVIGKYMEKIIYTKLDTKASDFDWAV